MSARQPSRWRAQHQTGLRQTGKKGGCAPKSGDDKGRCCDESYAAASALRDEEEEEQSHESGAARLPRCSKVAVESETVKSDVVVLSCSTFDTTLL